MYVTCMQKKVNLGSVVSPLNFKVFFCVSPDREAVLHFMERLSLTLRDRGSSAVDLKTFCGL